MSAAEYESLFTEPELRGHVVKFVGGSAAVTKVRGRGVTVSYVSTGIVEITWTDAASNPGVWVGAAGAPAFEATTPGDVKSFVGVVGVYNSTTRKLRLYLYESGTLADLAAAEWCAVTLLFKETSA